MQVPRAALAAALALAACGPSFQVVYEGDVHFEHCYALDQTATAPLDAKKACWRDWLHGDTTGQSRDRVEYAATRLSQLSVDPTTLPSEENPAQRPHKRLVAAPMPTSVFAPPPNVVDGNKPAATASAAAASASTRPPDDPVGAPRAPGAECAEACSRNWSGCHKECKETRGCDACDRAYRACVPACFGPEPPGRQAPGGAPPAPAPPPPARSAR